MSPAARVVYISLVFSNARRVLSQCNTRLRLLYLLNKEYNCFCLLRNHCGGLCGIQVVRFWTQVILNPGLGRKAVHNAKYLQMHVINWKDLHHRHNNYAEIYRSKLEWPESLKTGSVKEKESIHAQSNTRLRLLSPWKHIHKRYNIWMREEETSE